jgi:hypothetical protein
VVTYSLRPVPRSSYRNDQYPGTMGIDFIIHCGVIVKDCLAHHLDIALSLELGVVHGGDPSGRGHHSQDLDEDSSGVLLRCADDLPMNVSFDSRSAFAQD